MGEHLVGRVWRGPESVLAYSLQRRKVYGAQMSDVSVQKNQMREGRRMWIADGVLLRLSMEQRRKNRKQGVREEDYEWRMARRPNLDYTAVAGMGKVVAGRRMMVVGCRRERRLERCRSVDQTGKGMCYILDLELTRLGSIRPSRYPHDHPTTIALSYRIADTRSVPDQKPPFCPPVVLQSVHSPSLGRHSHQANRRGSSGLVRKTSSYSL